ICVAFLYGLASSIFIVNFFTSSYATLSAGNFENGRPGAVISSGVLTHTSQAENPSGEVRSLPATPAKSSPGKFSCWEKLKVQEPETTFLHYVFYAKSSLLRLRHTDLIFPFHYFW